MQLDPELELYAMPQRDLVRSDEDIKILVENFPEKSRATFLDWYEGYKVQVRAARRQKRVVPWCAAGRAAATAPEACPPAQG
jgi:hypothetical protein|tara:strand:+ start:373 stop:618 length:246 start_codon:yes stop_codon:yes gene_type:complete